MLTGFQRTTLYLSVRLHSRVRGRAWVTNTSMSKLIERWAWEGLERDEQAEQSKGPGATSPAAGPSHQPSE